MPLYEFTCTNGHTFERLFMATATGPALRPLVAICPTCTAPADRDFPKTGGVHFAGRGWTPKHHLDVGDLPPHDEVQAAKAESKAGR